MEKRKKLVGRRTGGNESLAVATIVTLVTGILLSACSQSMVPGGVFQSFGYGRLVAFNGKPAKDSLKYPRGLALDVSGRIFVADARNKRIVMMEALSASSWTVFPTDATPQGDRFVDPEGIAIGPGGDLWVADAGLQRVVRLKTADWQGGMPTFDYFSSVTVAGTSYPLSFPTGLAISGTTLYLTDPGTEFPKNTPRIFKIDISVDLASAIHVATGLALLGSKGTGKFQFSFPRGIAVDASGEHVYITDEVNYRVVRMKSDLASSWTTLGSRGNGSRQFISPQAIATDSSGRLYIADSGNYWIVRIDDMIGAGWTRYGFQSSSAAITDNVYPAWVAVDPVSSAIYVTDDQNYQVAEFE
jgi:DNA-binding beta-propeller fold protein YncE